MTVRSTLHPRHSLYWLALLGLLGLAACARVQVVPKTGDYAPDDRLVGTYYFYWYKYPDRHFFDNLETRDDALTDHFRRPGNVDYESVDWHEGELKDIAWCGIDFILPVYWGAPGAYDRWHGIFSVEGLKALQKARARMVDRGEPCPRIGMFYDTSTLLNSMRGAEPRNGKPDLRTPEGKDLFYTTIKEYWERLDPTHWATIDGRPITALYSAGFAAGYDPSTFEYVYEQFEKDFGVRPYIIAEKSWAAASPDAFYTWGAALTGPQIDDVAQIGPGYDDRAVPGRSTPIRLREDGRFYEYSWLRAIRSGRTIALIETWNEMHEGTDICESKEYGRQYMRMTREFARCFKKTVELEHPYPVPRGPTDEGKEFADKTNVSIDWTEGGSQGLRMVSAGDGLFDVAEQHGRRCAKSQPGSSAYLYFRVPDPFYFDGAGPVEIEVEYYDDGKGAFTLQYDSHDTDAHLAGAYKSGETVSRTGSNDWKTHTFRLDDAAFMSRQNHRTDFRLAVHGQPLCISRVEVRKVM